MNKIKYILQEVDRMRAFIYIKKPDYPYLVREVIGRSSRDVINFETYITDNEGEFTNFILELVYD